MIVSAVFSTSEYVISVADIISSDVLVVEEEDSLSE
jgi:hypothetical protein